MLWLYFDRCPDSSDEKVLDYDEAAGYALISGGAPTLPADAGCQNTAVLTCKLTPCIIHKIPPTKHLVVMTYLPVVLYRILQKD